MRFIAAILVILFSSLLQAQSSGIIKFSNGEVADADDVNSNFNNLDDRVKTLEADNTVSTSCSQSDMDGRWSFFIQSLPDGNYLKCDANINESQNGMNGISCELYDEYNAQGARLVYPEFSVKSNCQINLSVRNDPESSEITSAGYLIMTSDHKGLMGFTRNVSEGQYSTIHAIKLD